MGRASQIGLLCILLGLSLSQPARACGEDAEAKWQNPEKTMPAMTVDAAAATLEKLSGVLVEKSRLQSMCSMDVDYDVTDKSDQQFLGKIPVPAGDDGRYLVVRVAQLVTPSKDVFKRAMKNLHIASKAFGDDQEGLEEEWGILLYDPSAQPLNERFPGTKKQLLYASMEICRGKNPELLGSVLINTASYIPGRTDYTADTVYKRGDLRRILFSDETLFKAYKECALRNADESVPSHTDLTGLDWKMISRRLQTETVDQLQKTPYEIFSEKYRSGIAGIVTSANLGNINKIALAVSVDGQPKEDTYLGSVADMLLIERDLKKAGVSVSRNLDWKGKIDEEYHLLPAALALQN